MRVSEQMSVWVSEQVSQRVSESASESFARGVTFLTSFWATYQYRSSTSSHPHAPCDVPYFVPMLIGCCMALATPIVCLIPCMHTWGRPSRLVLLFSGPSGTGKTMTANALATHLKMKVLLVNFNTMVRAQLCFPRHHLGNIYHISIPWRRRSCLLDIHCLWTL